MSIRRVLAAVSLMLAVALAAGCSSSSEQAASNDAVAPQEGAGAEAALELVGEGFFVLRFGVVHHGLAVDFDGDLAALDADEHG